MPTKSLIIDGAYGTGQSAGVSPVGEVLVTGIGTLKSQSAFNSLNVINAAFNFFGPIAGQQFIITSIILDGPANATISIYEGASPSTINIDRLVYKVDLRSATNLIIPFSFGGFLAVSEGEYLNVLTDATTVNMTIVGYYSPITHNTE